jgi:uncharacterized protein
MSKVDIKELSDIEILNMGINHWPIWEKEVSRFDWFYESDEECLILEGEVIVETNEGIFTLKPGDFVTFKKGLSCVWEVKKRVRKHYSFK